MRPSVMRRSNVSRAISRLTGSKQERSTASGVSSMIRLTPVTDSKARMLRPSRPMMRPFISSPGRCRTETTDSLVCSVATRWMARVTILRARFSPSDLASCSIFRTMRAASRLAWFSLVATSSTLAAPEVTTQLTHFVLDRADLLFDLAAALGGLLGFLASPLQDPGGFGLGAGADVLGFGGGPVLAGTVELAAVGGLGERGPGGIRGPAPDDEREYHREQPDYH